MKRKIKSKYIIWFVIFSIGATLGKLLNWGYFELVKEISIIEALTLFITIGLAIYVAKILEKEVQEARVEKDLYIAKINELESLLNEFENILGEENIFYNKINSRIHSCRIKKNSIIGGIRENLKCLRPDDINSFETLITNKINSLKRLLTETSISQSQTPDLSVTNGVAFFSTNRMIEICTEVNAINENLFKLKVKINGL